MGGSEQTGGSEMGREAVSLLPRGDLLVAWTMAVEVEMERNG